MACRIAILIVMACVLAGCPQSTLTPSIAVSVSPNALTISGKGFNGSVSPCANLALEGLPQPYSNIPIGQAQCSGGSFQNFNWPFSYMGNGCRLTQSVSATVFATDTQGTNAGASQTISLGWGPNCGIAVSCPPGDISVNGTCSPCGGKGQPLCAGNTCQGDLHPNFQGGQIVCTASCGHTQSQNDPVPQSPCEVPLVPPDLSRGGVYTCYDSAMIDTFGNCTCVPNTVNTCPVSTSVPKPPQPNTGLCIQGQFQANNGNGCS